MVVEYAYWWLLPILVLSGTVAYLKFRKIARLPDIPSLVTVIVVALRFLVVFTLLFLLLNPALSLLRRVKEKPLLVVAQDNSLSIRKNKDSLYYQTDYKASLFQMLERLERHFDVDLLTFGSRVKRGDSLSFTENSTDLAGIFDYSERNYTLRQPQAMLLLSDGIYTSGVNPRYKTFSYPVYTVALGDTVVYPDVFVRNVELDKFNFIHTIFPIRVEVAAVKQNGKRIKCVLRENGKVVEEKTLSVNREHFLQELIFQAEAKRKGVVKYTIEIIPEGNDRIRENNQATAYAHIIDNSGHVAIFSAAPHPDIAALTNALEVSGIYQCERYNFSKPAEDLKANLIIFHNPEPGSPEYQKIRDWAFQRKISVWYMLTTRESIEAFSRFGKDYTAAFSTSANEYATIYINRNFPYFEFTESEKKGFEEYPPLVVPFGELNVRAGRLLFAQKIQHTPTTNGMIAFYDREGSRICYLWGEGFWRWRLYSCKENGNHDLFNTLVSKIVNYLAVQRGNDRFLHDIKPLYEEAEEAIINVELYNNSYELVNEPDIKLLLKYKGKEYDYLLSRNEEKYRINLGNLPAGEYDYYLSATWKGEQFEKKGNFDVKSRNIELNNLVADSQLLKDLATQSGGQSFEVRSLKDLEETLVQHFQSRDTERMEIRYVDLREYTLLGIILLILLCIEWFLLKYFVG